MTFRAIIQQYSLEPNKVGQDIGTPHVREFPDAREAVIYLHRVIDRREPHPKWHPSNGMAARYLVEIEGEQMPLNEAYRRTFGEEPIWNATGYRYPRLDRNR